jgi:hypothetical protein
MKIRIVFVATVFLLLFTGTVDYSRWTDWWGTGNPVFPK